MTQSNMIHQMDTQKGKLYLYNFGCYLCVVYKFYTFSKNKHIVSCEVICLLSFPLLTCLKIRLMHERRNRMISILQKEITKFVSAFMMQNGHFN